MIDPTRIEALNGEAVNPGGRYVLYWMQASQRAEWNHALEYAAARANELRRPLVVGFGLTDEYPEANERHYAFMLEGLGDVRAALRRRGVRLAVRHGEPPGVAVALAADAALVVCDRGYLRHQKRWRGAVAARAGCRVVQVESDVVVPVGVASDRQETAARTLRPRHRRHWERYLVPLATVQVERPSLRLRLPGDGDGREVDVSDVPAALGRLKLDRSVRPSPVFRGGAAEAGRVLARFLSERLSGYAANRSEPAAGATSTLSAYLHFGQISPLEVALAVGAHRGAAPTDRDAFLDEILVRRELAVNYCHYCPRYDRYEGVPGWARRTLADHAKDRRPRTYTLRQLESAATDDPYWNAAQDEMVLTGFMHNHMRMYWGKKVLEWTRSPRQAFAATLYLNNKYFLCGRDPNAYANVAWVFGLHDRPWGPRREVFGTVRYMNAAGLERKFDIGAYVAKVGAMRERYGGGGEGYGRGRERDRGRGYSSSSSTPMSAH
ncbi:MAG TPA: deoxyribodipyrimidine photo-lyase [Tepidisphaeraceae bacterium]|nr:deoxyribodipyrimidine photo-lyase [Tepidisphaeraceae bacterium]